MDQTQLENILTFHQADPAATPPMRADKSALGTMPSVAYQFCEALRTASAFGWYIFPPREIRLLWDGADVFHAENGEWKPLSSLLLDEEFVDHWETYAPADLKDRAPPYLSSLLVPGVVQIWSGFLVSSADDWAILVRPPANIPLSRGYACYEGIVETDRFKPCPLFVNIRLISTNCEIVIPPMKPLFQVQPLRRECYADSVLDSYELRDIGNDAEKGMSRSDWDGFRGTIRDVVSEDDPHRTGSYGAGVRRRRKRS